MGLTAALELVLSSRFFTNKVIEVLEKNIDADVSMSKVRVSALRVFPSWSVSIDDLLLTYPHDRYAAYDSLSTTRFHEAGRGAEKDTLAGFDRFFVAANPWHIIGGKIRVGKAFLDGTRLYAHAYADSTANWNIFKGGKAEEDTTEVKKPATLPMIVLGKLKVDIKDAYYTDLRNGIAAQAGIGGLTADGRMKIKAGEMSVPYSAARLDSLALNYLFRGKEFPLRLDGSAEFRHTGGASEIKVPGIEIDAATVPIHIDGEATMYRDSIPVDAHVRIKDFETDTFVREYAPYIAEVASDFRTDALLNVDASAKGVYTPTKRPDVDVKLSIPRGRILYIPMGIAGRLKLDATADDLLGADPAFTLNGDIHARLDSVRSHISAKQPMLAYGELELKLDADAPLSALSKYEFHKARIHGEINGEEIGLSIPGDSLRTRVFRPGVEIDSSPVGLDLMVAVDSIFFHKGVALLAKVRDMRNEGVLHKTLFRDEMVPTLDFQTTGRDIFLRADANRVGVRGFDVKASVRKSEQQKRQIPDSLRRRDPSKPLPLFLSDKSLESGDINIALDPTKSDLLAKWNPMASVRFGSGMVASPVIPLKTRFGGFSVDFNGDKVQLDSFKVTSGTSDVAVKGYVSGLRRALRRKGLIRTDLSVHSSNFNLNEIVSALDIGKSIPKDTSSVVPENDESFVVDSIANAEFVEIPMPLVIVPANIIGKLNVGVDKFSVMDFLITPATLSAQIQERKLQINNAELYSNIGTIGFNAYYSTQSNDVYLGAELLAMGMSVPKIMGLLPNVTEKVPLLANFEGNLQCDASLTTQLDTNMNVIVPTLDGVVNIQGTDLNITDAGNLRKITSLLLFRNKNIGHIDDLSLNLVVHDNKLEIFPFELGVDRYRLALQGMQGFDKSMYYHVSVLRSPLLIPFGVDVYGTLDKWRFSLCRAKFRNGRVPAFTEELGNMKLNIVTSIHDIFNKSVKDITYYNRKTINDIEAHKQSIGYSADTPAETLSNQEFAAIDSLTVLNEALEWDAGLEDEVNAVLEESYKETSKILEEYTNAVYDKRILRRMERMKKREEKKKK